MSIKYDQSLRQVSQHRPPDSRHRGHWKSSRMLAGIVTTALIALSGASGSLFASSKFKIDDAKYKSEKSELKIKGKSADDALVNLYDADSGIMFATTTADDEGKWKYKEKNLPAIPCHVRAVSDGRSDEKKVEHAKDFPGGCGIHGGGNNQPPVAMANGPYSGITNALIHFSSAGSTDPDGNIASYLWDFGDGQSSNLPNPDHSYNSAGSYPVTLTVVDDQGASGSDTTTAQINDPGQPGEVSINSTSQNRTPENPVSEQPFAGNTNYKLFGSNDLGMHCGDFDTRISSILPPFNVLHAQVIQRGKDPKILNPNDGISVRYSAASNPTDPVLTGINSSGDGPVMYSLATDGTAFKTNFWDIADGGSETIALAAYRPFYPPGVLDAFAPNPGQGLPAPNVERLYLGDGQLTAEQQHMPGSLNPMFDNVMQQFGLFTLDQPFFINFPFGYTARDVNWYEAAGVPMTAFDDSGRENPWPLYRFQAHDTNGNILASTDVVLPISGEANCGACHNAPIDGGNGSATEALGNNVATVFDDPTFDVSSPLAVSLEYAADINLLRLHDLKNNTDLENSTPVVCQTCHYTPALDLAQVGPKGPADADANGREQTNVRSMSNVMHKHHASVTDTNGDLLFPDMPAPFDANGNPRDPVAARQVLGETCYQCHPGQRTDCLRGAMADGGMLCQDCHGDMNQVGSDFSDFVSPSNPGDFRLAGDFYTNPDTLRMPWANEPGCGSCHTGDANDNMRGTPGTVNAADDLIRLVQAYLDTDVKATPIVPTNKRFAENVVASTDPGAGNPMLYRVSTGHEGVFCEACHGATHGIWPNKNPLANDNVASMQLQGHTGTIAECSTCHEGDLGSNLDGPHGLHPIGVAGIKFAEGDHGDLAEKKPDDCRACHGQNGEGTVLSAMAQERTLKCDKTTQFCPNGNDTIFPNDHQVGCTECHGNKL